MEKPAHSNRVNILLVDDQPARLLSYRTVLAELGQNLVSVHSGTEALQRLMLEEFALILLDVSMPGMDGFETAAMIHDHPRFERTPIIFVTGVHDTEFDRLKGYKLGAVDYVSIPVVPEILRSKVAVLVELHCQRRELQKLNRSLEAANRQLAAANTTLQAEKTRELQALNADLQVANHHLEQSNAALQRQIGERARAESALKEADRRKNEFLAILAHELRNPLAALSGAAALLGRDGQKPEIIAMAREGLQRQVHHMARLLDDLLDVARITHGLVQLRMEPLRVADAIHAAVETVRPQVEARHHRLVVEIPEQPAYVKADAVRLSQIICNLLNNSTKYTPDGGLIALRMQTAGDRAVISIEDNGIGISPAMLDQVFEMFSQANRSAQGPHGGLGIGLALVKGLVDLHQGTIHASSGGEGAGSTFTLTLPLVEASAEHAGKVEANAVPSTGGSLRILVADDNVDSATNWSVFLQQGGHQVRTAYDGVAALNEAEQFRPHVALLDIGMPRLDGYGLARRIRATPWGRDALLVAITGWGQAKDREMAHEAGFDQHFTKPVDPAQIEAVLRRATGQSGAGTARDLPRANTPIGR